MAEAPPPLGAVNTSYSKEGCWAAPQKTWPVSVAATAISRLFGASRSREKFPALGALICFHGGPVQIPLQVTISSGLLPVDSILSNTCPGNSLYAKQSAKSDEPLPELPPLA